MRYYLKRFDDGGFEFSPCPKGKPRDGFSIVDELPADIIAALDAAASSPDPLALINSKLVEIENKIKELEEKSSSVKPIE